MAGEGSELERAKKEYERLVQLRNSRLGALWNSNRIHLNKRLKEEAEKERRAVWVIGRHQPSNGKKLKPMMIEAVSSLPNMEFWTPIQKNFLVREERVTRHIPYLGDEVLNKGGRLVKELLDGCDVSDEERDLHLHSDELLEQLVDNIASAHQKEKARGRLSERGTDSRQMPSLAIFKTISPLFSSSHSRLRERYKRLKGEDRTKGTSVWFCRRCYLYNCFLHDVSEVPPQNVRKGPPLKKSVCGPDCFFLKDGVNVEQTSKHNHMESSTAQGSDVPCEGVRLKRQDSVDSGNDGSSEHSDTSKDGRATLGRTELKAQLNNAGVNQPTWSPEDKSMFHRLNKVFDFDFCTISLLLINKTCTQVYEMAVAELGASQVAQGLRQEWRGAVSKKSSIKARRWTERKGVGLTLQERFRPCSHPGQQCDDHCSCVSLQNYCEKFCHCSPHCQNRFSGCRCRAQCNTKHCPCYVASRECDPDLCSTCGADKFQVSDINCKNISIQRNLHKHLLMGKSDVAGWGVFAKEAVKKNEFVYEYCGELVSHEEADHRGKLYDHNRCSYLFNLNNDYVVDAMRKGNKIRFANHSLNPNCFSKVKMVNGDHRLGIFAKRDIRAGEELFFDYRYSPQEQLKFVSVELKLE